MRIPTPERGQPLDLSYIYTIVDTINQLAEESSALNQGNNLVINSRGGAQSTSKIYKSQIIGSYVTIGTSNFNTSSSEATQTVTFDQAFSEPPIVTATIVNTGNTVSGTDISVVLKNITTQSCDVTVKFTTSDITSVGVNLIAIGLPSGV